MSSGTASVGGSVRPAGSLAFGTIGCLAMRKGVVHLVTCDHVIRRLGTPESGPLRLYPRFDGSPANPIAEFRGLTLTSREAPVADLAAAPLLGPPPAEPSRLPPASPRAEAREMTDTAPVAEGQRVRIWGARTAAYHTGRIVAERSRERLPHPRYGSLLFEMQFAMQIDPTFLPEVGDSGGPVLTEGGRLVGFLSGGPLTCRVTEAGECIAYGVPAREALGRMRLEAIVSSMKEGDDGG